MKDYWKIVCRVQNILMFGMGFFCLCSGWTEMTRIVFCVYYTVAGILLAVGIAISNVKSSRSSTSCRRGTSPIRGSRRKAA